MRVIFRFDKAHFIPKSSNVTKAFAEDKCLSEKTMQPFTALLKFNLTFPQSNRVFPLFAFFEALFLVKSEYSPYFS